MKTLQHMAALALAALAAGATMAARPEPVENAAPDGGGYDEARRELTSTWSFPLADGALIEVDAQAAAITVEGWDRQEVSLTAIRGFQGATGFFGLPSGDWSGKARAREVLEGAAVSADCGEDAVRVRARFDTPEAQSRVQVRLTLNVPRDAVLKLVSGNGRISVKGAGSAVEARAGNGEVSISETPGGVQVQTSNGAIRLASIEGDVHAVAGNGTITCDGVSGSAHLSTANGTIEARGARGKELVCVTGNGSIEVQAARGAGYALDLKTGSGTVRCGVPLDAPAMQERGVVQGTVQGGGGVLSLRARNGNITVAEE